MTRINRKPLGVTARARRAKAAKDRRYAAKIREQVDARDGYCKLMHLAYALGLCAGPSEWAHWAEFKRFKTRGLPPEERHTTAGSFKACSRHHGMYDAREFEIAATDISRGMDSAIVVTKVRV